MMSFSEKITQLRTSKKLSLEQLAQEFARKYNAKTSKSSIYRWEKGESKPNIDDANMYADYFNVSLDWLIGNKTNEDDVTTIAAHHDGDEWTDEELEEIEKFMEFVKAKRKQQE